MTTLDSRLSSNQSKRRIRDFMLRLPKISGASIPVIAAIYSQNLIIRGSWPKNILRPSAVNNRNLTVANAVLTGTLCDPRT